MAKNTGKNQSHKEMYGKGGRKLIGVRVDDNVYNTIKANAEKAEKNISHYLHDFLKEHLKND